MLYVSGVLMEAYRNRIYEKYASVFKNSQSKFNEDAAYYWGLPYNYYLRSWLPNNKDVTILDMGCGDGKLLYFFIKNGYTNVQGVDISHEQVTIAKQACLTVHEGKVSDFLASNLDTFDLITGIDFLEHLFKDEALRILDLCYTALKTNGRIILQLPNSDSPMSNSVHHADFTHELQLNPSSLSHLLRLSGFSAVEIREQGPVPWGYSFKSSLRFVAWYIIRSLIMLWNLAETASCGSGVFTRVFIISGTKSCQ